MKVFKTNKYNLNRKAPLTLVKPYRSLIVGTSPIVLLPAVVDSSNPHCRRPDACTGITRLSFINLRRRKVWVGSAAREYSEIWRCVLNTAEKMKFSNKDFFSKCDQIRRKLQIWSHLLKKSLMENFIFFVQCKEKRNPSH